jgi:hypothetical protein
MADDSLLPLNADEKLTLDRCGPLSAVRQKKQGGAMTRTIAAYIFLFPLLSSCARLTPEQQAALQQAANRPVTCTTGKDCEEKWSRAVHWVTQNSAYKIQAVSDNVIQTMGPLPDDPRPAFTVTKVFNGNDTYTLNLHGGCDNIWGCVPDPIKLALLNSEWVMRHMG